MKSTTALGLIVMLFSMLSISSIARAECVAIGDFGPEKCSGSNGCMGAYEFLYCSWGCAAGTCVAHGGSGLCCGTIYYSPEIYPNGTRCTDCGEIRIHASKPPTSRFSAELRQGYSPGLIKISDNLSYKEPRIVYVLDRCNHTYGVVEEDGAFVEGNI